MPPLSKDQQAVVERVVAVLAQGGLPALYPAQNDTFQYEDNVDASNPCQFDFIVPANLQKVTAARLSFRLRGYRTYNKTAAAGLHVHFWSSVGGVAISTAVGLDNTQRLVGASFAFGKQTSTELYSLIVAAQASLDTAIEGYDSTGHVHAQVLGVTAGATASGVTVALDGTDITAALGGPFSADQVELDFRGALLGSGPPTPGFHTLSIASATLGRIQAIARLGYVVNTALP